MLVLLFLPTGGVYSSYQLGWLYIVGMGLCNTLILTVCVRVQWLSPESIPIEMFPTRVRLTPVPIVFILSVTPQPLMEGNEVKGSPPLQIDPKWCVMCAVAQATTTADRNQYKRSFAHLSPSNQE